MNRRGLISGLLAGSTIAIAPVRVLADEESEAANVETVRRWFDEFRPSRNAEMVREFVSEDYTSQDPESAPGVDAYVARTQGYFDSLARTFTTYEWFTDAVIAQDNIVVWRGREKGASTDGKLIEAYFLYWFELNEDHKITTFWGGIDPAKALDFWMI